MRNYKFIIAKEFKEANNESADKENSGSPDELSQEPARGAEGNTPADPAVLEEESGIEEHEEHEEAETVPNVDT